MNTPITVFVDLSKAFDTLDHDILLEKLKYDGITGVSLKLYMQMIQLYQQPLKLSLKIIMLGQLVK